jgi:hypothetical protein
LFHPNIRIPLCFSLFRPNNTFINARIVEYGVPIFHLSLKLVWIYVQDHRVSSVRSDVNFCITLGRTRAAKDVAAMMRGHEPVKVFSSFGDLGDTLIHQMPAMQLMGGGELVLYPVDNSKVREPWTRKKVERVRTFFESLGRKSVRFEDKPEGIVLDQWRTIITLG